MGAEYGLGSQDSCMAVYQLEWRNEFKRKPIHMLGGSANVRILWVFSTGLDDYVPGALLHPA